jgi:hypothetical protein
LRDRSPAKPCKKTEKKKKEEKQKKKISKPVQHVNQKTQEAQVQGGVAGRLNFSKNNYSNNHVQHLAACKSALVRCE